MRFVEDDNYSDLDELFGENCKFLFFVMNQNLISKKPKAKKVSSIIHFILLHKTQLLLLLADGADDVSTENNEENDGNKNAEDNDIDVGNGNNCEVSASRLQHRLLT